MVRRLTVVILMTGAILSAGCGVVEERKNAALREVGRAALSSVLEIASRGGSSANSTQSTQDPLVIAKAESDAKVRETARVARATQPAAASTEVTVEATAPREEIFTFAFDSESIDAAPLVKRVASARNESNRRRNELLIEAKELRIERAKIDEALHHASMAVSAAAPEITAHSDALVEIRVAERLNADELRRFITAIPRPATPPPAPSEGCSSQARTAS